MEENAQIYQKGEHVIVKLFHPPRPWVGRLWFIIFLLYGLSSCTSHTFFLINFITLNFSSSTLWNPILIRSMHMLICMHDNIFTWLLPLQKCICLHNVGKGSLNSIYTLVWSCSWLRLAKKLKTRSLSTFDLFFASGPYSTLVIIYFLPKSLRST